MKKTIGIIIVIVVALIIVVYLLVSTGVVHAQGIQPNQHTTPGTLEGSHRFTGKKMTATSVTWHSQNPRWLMVFDTQTLPSNGAFTAGTPLIVCQFIQGAGDTADGTANYDWTTHPIIASQGLLVAVSTNPASCTALTVDGANDWIAGQMGD